MCPSIQVGGAGVRTASAITFMVAEGKADGIIAGWLRAHLNDLSRAFLSLLTKRGVAQRKIAAEVEDAPDLATLKAIVDKTVEPPRGACGRREQRYGQILLNVSIPGNKKYAPPTTETKLRISTRRWR